MATVLDELEKLEANRLAPIYLLYGNDLYLEQEALGTLSTLFAKAANSEVEKRIFQAEENQDEAFVQSLYNLGMFATHQIVIYKNIHQLSTISRKQFLQYCARPAETTMLILTAGSGSKSKFFDTIKSSESVKTLSIWTPKADEFPAIIVKQFTKHGYQIEPDAVEILALSTNDSLAHTFSEIEKIMIYVGERNLITATDVRSVGGGEKTYQMADFIQAIAEKNLPLSIQICLNLIETGAEAPFFISSLYNLFVNVWAYPQIYKNAPKSASQSKKYRDNYRHGYQNYQHHDFASLFCDLLDTDLKTKSTGLGAKDLMIPLICNILKA
jgi:DNA polymerase-3 subunit delta